MKAGDLVMGITELIGGSIYVVENSTGFGAIKVLGYSYWFDASHFKKVNINGEL